MDGQTDAVLKAGFPQASLDAHASYVAAMRNLIRLGLPVIEVSQDQVMRAAHQLLDIYRKSAEGGAANLSLLIKHSMEIRQILNALPTVYLSALQACVLSTVQEWSRTMSAEEAASVGAAVTHRIAEFRREAGVDGPGRADAHGGDDAGGDARAE